MGVPTDTEPRTSTRPAVVSGIAGALIGATCCIGPAVGVALGASAGSFLLALTDYRFVVFGIGTAVTAFSIWWHLRRRRATYSSDAAFQALRSRWVDAAMIAFGLTYVLGRFLVSRVIERF
jgi:hypothetical protein